MPVRPKCEIINHVHQQAMLHTGSKGTRAKNFLSSTQHSSACQAKQQSHAMPSKEKPCKENKTKVCRPKSYLVVFFLVSCVIEQYVCRAPERHLYRLPKYSRELELLRDLKKDFDQSLLCVCLAAVQAQSILTVSNKTKSNIQPPFKLTRLRSLEVLGSVGALCASCRRDDDHVLRNLRAKGTIIPYARERNLNAFLDQSMCLREMLQSRMMQTNASGWQELGRRGTP